MRFSVAYTIYNKVDLIPLIIEGMKYLDSEIEILVFFDNCTDGSVEVFLAKSKALRNLRVFSNDGYDWFETRANNYLLRQSTGDVCVLFQDDMIIKDDGFLMTIQEIMDRITNVGVIGFKDGYSMEEVNKFKNFVSSPWSESRNVDRRLREGEYLEKPYVNRGPLAIPRSTFERVGFFDESFFPLFWDDNDYCYRCRQAGLSNWVAYSDIDSNQLWGATRGDSKIPLSMCYYVNRLRFQQITGLPGIPLKLKDFNSVLAFLRFKNWRFFARMKSYRSKVTCALSRT